MLAIESNCTWAVPVDTWTKPVLHKPTVEEKKNLGNLTNSLYPVGTPHLYETKGKFLGESADAPAKSAGCRV